MAGLNSLAIKVSHSDTFISLKKGVNSFGFDTKKSTFISLKKGLNNVSTSLKSTWVVKITNEQGDIFTDPVTIDVINTENPAEFYAIDAIGGYATVSVFKEFTTDANGFEVVNRFIDTKIVVKSSLLEASQTILNATTNGGLIEVPLVRYFVQTISLLDKIGHLSIVQISNAFLRDDSGLDNDYPLTFPPSSLIANDNGFFFAPKKSNISIYFDIIYYVIGGRNIIETFVLKAV